MWYLSLITRTSSRARQPMPRENVTGLLRLLQDFFHIKIENIYLFKIIIIIIIKHGNVFKTWLCPNFLLLPKQSELPKIWGGCSNPPPPARMPMEHPTTFFPVKQLFLLKSKYCLEISEARERLKIFWQPFLPTVFGGCVFHILLPQYCYYCWKKRFPENFGIKKNCTLETFGHWVPLHLVMRITITIHHKRKDTTDTLSKPCKNKYCNWPSRHLAMASLQSFRALCQSDLFKWHWARLLYNTAGSTILMELQQTIKWIMVIEPSGRQFV